MKRKFPDYHEKLIQDLKHPNQALAYLNAALVDDNDHVFFLALKDVIEAWNVRSVRKKMHNSALTFKSAQSIMGTLGLQFVIKRNNQ